MNARIITKSVEIENRKFSIKKYTATDGLKFAKVLIAKILPAFQTFVPLLSEKKNDGGIKNILSNLGDFLSLDTIAAALDKISPEDFDYITKKSLQNVSEVLPAGEAQVMNADGTYGVLDIEYDTVLVLRLVCEAVMWGLGDFFDGNRLVSIMSPLSSSFPSSLKI